MPTAPQIATNRAIATRTSRVRKCQVDGLSQLRCGIPELLATPESVLNA